MKLSFAALPVFAFLSFLGSSPTFAQAPVINLPADGGAASCSTAEDVWNFRFGTYVLTNPSLGIRDNDHLGLSVTYAEFRCTKQPDGTFQEVPISPIADILYDTYERDGSVVHVTLKHKTVKLLAVASENGDILLQAADIVVDPRTPFSTSVQFNDLQISRFLSVDQQTKLRNHETVRARIELIGQELVEQTGSNGTVGGPRLSANGPYTLDFDLTLGADGTYRVSNTTLH